MKKKLLFLVPVLAMVLAGCSPQTPSSSATSAPTTTEGPTSTTSGAPTSESSDPTSVTPTSESTATTPTSQSSGTPTPTSESTSEAPEPVPVTGIKMNSPYDVKLQVGETSQIDAEILPENADDKIILYSSTKEAVATVSSTGLITAVGVGTATINVVSHESDTIKKTVNVSVDPEGFLPAAETDDGYSLVTNLSSLSNGDLVKIVGYSAGEPYSIKKDSYYTAEKISYDENDKVVTSNSMEFIFELQMGEGGGYAAIKTYDSANEKYMYIGAKGSSNGIQWYESLGEEKTHLGAELDSEGYATITAAGAKMNTLALNLSGGVYIRFYEPAKAETYRKLCLYRKTPQFYTGISVKTAPDKTNYVEGEEFDPAGMEIQANKNYGDPDPVTEFTYGPAIPLTVEDTEITIYATVGGENFECSQPIVVREKVLSSLEVTTPPDKTVYNIGDAFATEGMVVKAVFNAGVEGFERIDEDFKDYDVSPEYFTTAGEQKVTLSVDGSSAFAEVDVTVNPASLQSIEVTTPPTKLEYYVGDAFDPEGLVITGHYDDESTATIPNSSLEFDPATFTEAGDAVEVKATVKGSEISCQITGITVTAVELDHIEVTAEPTLTEYMVRDELDLAGLEVTAYYNNGDEEVLTADEYTTDPEDGYAFVAADVGTKEITVSFGGEEDTFEVSVEAYNGIKRAYEAGEALAAGATTSEEYEMEGVVSAICTGTVDKPYEFLIQDGEYGMYVYTSTQSLYALGDLVKVTSKISNFRGMIETVKITSTEGSKEKIGTGEVPQPVVIETLEDLAGVNQNVLLNLENIEIKTPLEGWSSSAHVNTYGVSLNEEDLTLCLKKEVYQESVNTVLTRCKEGEEVKLTHCFKSMFDDVQCRLTLSTSADDSMNTRYVEEIVLDKETLSLVVDGTGQVSVTEVLPEIATDKTYTWTSTNTDIATVDESGNVTAVAVGDCDIKAVANDAGHAEGVCHVTVTSASVPVESVTLDQDTLSLQVGEGTESLTATVKPDNATNTNVSWKSDDEDVATVDENGVVAPVGAGTCTITVTTEDGGFTDTCNVTVTEPIIDVLTTSTFGLTSSSYSSFNFVTVSERTVYSGNAACNTSKENALQIRALSNESCIYMNASSRYVSKVEIEYQEGASTLDVYGKNIGFESASVDDATKIGTTQNGVLEISGDYSCILLTASSSVAYIKSISIVYKGDALAASCDHVSISENEAKCGVGEDHQLVAFGYGTGLANEVTWSSDNISIATVSSNGLVTAIGGGTCTITATSKIDNSKSASCEFTVSSASTQFSADFSTKEASGSAYTADEWSYGDYMLAFAANNNAGWDYIKIGKKSGDCTGYVKTTIASKHTINEIKVNFAAGSLNKAGMSVDEWGVYVYSDASCSTEIGHVVSTDTITKGYTGSYSLLTATDWAVGSYFKVYFKTSNTTTTNGVVCVQSINFIG